jgi:hypothetical protein
VLVAPRRCVERVPRTRTDAELMILQLSWNHRLERRPKGRAERGAEDLMTPHSAREAHLQGPCDLTETPAAAAMQTLL